MDKTSTFERLRAMAAAHSAAFGADHPLLAAALASGDEGVALAAIAHVEKTAPKETVGLAAVSKEISESKIALDLWSVLDVVRPTEPITHPLTPYGFLQRSGAVRPTFEFRREAANNIAREPIAFRILTPANGGINCDLLEALGRSLRTQPFQFIGQAEPARAALIAAAAQRSTK